MRTVHKYEFGQNTEIRVPWPHGARVVLVAQQGNTLPTLWVECDTTLDAQLRYFCVIGTGHPVTPPDLEHVGSAVCGSFVWHVYGEGVSS